MEIRKQICEEMCMELAKVRFPTFWAEGDQPQKSKLVSKFDFSAISISKSTLSTFFGTRIWRLILEPKKSSI